MLYEVITNAEEYREKLEEAFRTDRPVIVEARIQEGDYDDVILRNHK